MLRDRTVQAEGRRKSLRDPPVGRRREQQKRETRSAVLASARSLFEKRGFEGTTIRAIAALAGVGLGTVVAHFPDKQSLLVAALLDDLADVQARALRTMPAAAPIDARLMHLARAFYRYYARRTALSRTLLKEMWFVPGEWGDLLMEHAREFIALVAALLKAAQERGEVTPDADCDLAAMSFFSHYLNVLLAGLSGPEFAPEQSIAALGRLFGQAMAGIGTPPPGMERRRRRATR